MNNLSFPNIQSTFHSKQPTCSKNSCAIWELSSTSVLNNQPLNAAEGNFGDINRKVTLDNFVQHIKT